MPQLADLSVTQKPARWSLALSALFWLSVPLIWQYMATARKGNLWLLKVRDETTGSPSLPQREIQLPPVQSLQLTSTPTAVVRI